MSGLRFYSNDVRSLEKAEKSKKVFQSYSVRSVVIEVRYLGRVQYRVSACAAKPIGPSPHGMASALPADGPRPRNAGTRGLRRHRVARRTRARLDRFKAPAFGGSGMC